MFYDRADAGSKLGDALKAYKGKGVIVLAIPRGGVEVGYYAAKKLKADFNLLIVRKLPLPSNPEAGFGAIAEDGSTHIQKDAKYWVSESDAKRIKAEQRVIIKEHQKLRVKPLPSLKGKTVILVDDGIAMGSTIIAGVKAVRKLGAKKVVVASPVSGKNVNVGADELVVLETPDEFYGVAQVYYQWHDCTNEEVLKLVKHYK